MPFRLPGAAGRSGVDWITIGCLPARNARAVAESEIEELLIRWKREAPANPDAEDHVHGEWAGGTKWPKR